MSTADKNGEIQREYVTDATFIPRMSRAFIRFVFTRPSTVAILVVLGVVGVAALAVGIVGESPGLTVVGVLYLVLAPLVALIGYLRTSRGNARRVPIGSRIAVGLGPTSMRVEGPLGSSDTSYRAYRRAYLRGGFVILRHQGIRAYSMFPVELFPGDELGRLRDAIDRSNR